MTWIEEQPVEKIDGMREKMAERNWTVAGRDWPEEGNDDEAFALWLYLCDRRMTRALGLGIFDIEDWRWHDAYTDDYSPAESVSEALEYAGMML